MAANLVRTIEDQRNVVGERPAPRCWGRARMGKITCCMNSVSMWSSVVLGEVLDEVNHVLTRVAVTVRSSAVLESSPGRCVDAPMRRCAYAQMRRGVDVPKRRCAEARMRRSAERSRYGEAGGALPRRSRSVECADASASASS